MSERIEVQFGKCDISEKEKAIAEKNKLCQDIFHKKLDSIEKLDKSKIISGIEMVKEADAIIYQIKDVNKELRYDTPFQIGLGDIKDREKFSVHLQIEKEVKRKIEDKLKQEVDVRKCANGLIFRDKDNKLNLLFDLKGPAADLTESLINIISDEDGMLRFQDMLERYKIARILEDTGKNIEKIVWDIQTSGYAKKQGITITEFLRWRLIGAKLSGKSKKH